MRPAVLEFVRRQRLRGVYLDVGTRDGVAAAALRLAGSPSAIVGVDGDDTARSRLAAALSGDTGGAGPVLFLRRFVSSRPAVFVDATPEARGEPDAPPLVADVPITEASQRVETVTLDAACGWLPRIDLVHVRVGPQVLEVLESCKQVLARWRPDVLVRHGFADGPFVDRLMIDQHGYLPLRRWGDEVSYYRRGGAAHGWVSGLPGGAGRRAAARYRRLLGRIGRLGRGSAVSVDPERAPAGVGFERVTPNGATR